MSEAYVAVDETAPDIHTLSPQTIWEALVGVRDYRQRRQILDPSVPHYSLDRRLRSGTVVRVSGAVRGDRCWLAFVVRLADGEHLAASVLIDRAAHRPVVSAVVL